MKTGNNAFIVRMAWGKNLFSVFLLWPFENEATFQRATIESLYGQGDDSPLKVYLSVALSGPGVVWFGQPLV